MRHALIIGRDRNAAEHIENNLWNAGYPSLVHALDAGETWAMLPWTKPSLIVLLGDAAPDFSANALYRMSGMAETPVLVAMGDPAKALACLGGDASLTGPYPVGAVEQAVEDAKEAEADLAHAA